MNHKYNSMASVTVLYMTADRKKKCLFYNIFFLDERKYWKQFSEFRFQSVSLIWQLGYGARSIDPNINYS